MGFKWGKQIQVWKTGEARIEIIIHMRSVYNYTHYTHQTYSEKPIVGETNSRKKFLRENKVKTNWLLRRRVSTSDTVTKEKFFPKDLKVDTTKWDKQQF